MLIVASLIVSAAVVWGGLAVAAAVRAAQERRDRDRTAALLQLFAPALAAAQADARAFLVWQPIATAARALFPQEFAQLDRAWGGAFPFSRDAIQAAHAQWTADWLAWERAHDAEFKLKATRAQAEFAAAPASEAARGTVDAIEREKLDSYQRRYAEYVRVAKALQALST